MVIHTTDENEIESVETPAEKAKAQSNEDILATARKRFNIVSEVEREQRSQALDDLKFRAGEQWPTDVKTSRELDGRPCLTINRLPQFVRQITNDQRQNRPSIKVNPFDDLADVETAKILQGIVRHIEYNSNADVAYDTAFEGAVTKGIGYLRVLTEYCDPHSFDQEIKIKRIRNSFSVYLDPNYQEPDGSDANWGFIFEDLRREDFLAQYKDSELAGMNSWAGIGDDNNDWVNKDTIRVAEYFAKEFKEVTLVLLSDGAVIDKSTLPEVLPGGVTIVNERVAQVPMIRWYKISAAEILEQTEWPGMWIPIIPVLGDELDVEGKRILEGVIRHAKDSQRMYNYWSSSETETIALAPRAPFIGVEGQFEGHEEAWETANRKNHAYLQYKMIDLNGTPVGPPQRNVFEPNVQAITQARMLASDDLKATTGIYDSALGNRSNENSGVAIQRRNAQSQTANFHFVDNLSRSIRHVGRIVVDLIPRVYDTKRAVRTLGEDGSVDIVRVNEMFKGKDGTTKQYNLGIGKYDVTVSVGPSYATKRQEGAASMLELTKAYPQMFQIMGDLMLRNLDVPGAQEMADRVKKTLAPGIVDDKEKPPIPPEVQNQMQQQEQALQAMSAELAKAQETIKFKILEIESKERIEFQKLEVDLKKEAIKYQGQAALETLKKEIADIDRRQAMLHQGEPITTEFNEPAPSMEPAPIEQQLTGESSPGLPME